jgi:membrane-bound lytic murein transglycosylase MltF
MTRYFSDVKFSDQNRALFAFASYNAGPGNLAKMRTAALTRGLAPNQWVNNVEVVTAARSGIEPTTYVRNIYKYYVAYKLMQDVQAAQRRAHEQVAPVAK